MHHLYAIFELFSSFILLQPNKIISLLISSFILIKIFSTPACPPAPKANRKPFPKLQAVAPNDKAKARENAISAVNEINWGRKTLSVRINGLDTPYWYRDVVELVEKTGTVVIVSHSFGLLTDICDRIGVVHEGKLEMVGEPKEAIKAYYELTG